MDRLDVLTVTYRSQDAIAELISSVGPIKKSFEVRVLLHDNSADRALIERARGYGAERGVAVSGSVCEDNCGFARACNALARSSDADWFLFLNPDARIQEWPTAWLPARGVWGPLVLDRRGRRRPTYGRSRTVLTEILLLLGRRRPQEPEGQGYVSGAALLIDRESFERLGGFDEGYFMYYEDIDLGIRASAKGVQVNLQRDWVVVHEGGASVGSDHALAANRSYESAVRFHELHGHKWRLYALTLALFACLRSCIGIIRPAWRPQSHALASVSVRAFGDALTGRRESH